MSRFVKVPAVGHVFTFRWKRGWRWWKWGTGVGRVIAVDEQIGVVHIAAYGSGANQEQGSEIQHMPIVEDKLLQSILTVHADNGFDQQTVWPQIIAWRAAHAAGEAGAFALSPSEAIEMILETVDDPSPVVLIETAYPVKDSSGTFRSVRAVAHSSASE